MNFKLEKACYLISNLPKQYNLYNQFLVQETYKDYFTITLTRYAQGLLPYNKVEPLLSILNELKFYYKDIQKEYFKLGCGFSSKEKVFHKG